MRRRRRKPIIRAVPIDGYSTLERRLEFLQRKMEAEGRMRIFDNYSPGFRSVYNASGTLNNATVCWRHGCRTFYQAEKAIAGVWDGR